MTTLSYLTLLACYCCATCIDNRHKCPWLKTKFFYNWGSSIFPSVNLSVMVSSFRYFRHVRLVLSISNFGMIPTTCTKCTKSKLGSILLAVNIFLTLLTGFKDPLQNRDMALPFGQSYV